ncbi:hypothetical protein CRG98_031255 [Punica granatum]|uniref:Uncharacterized protein n=1 Tax=Punica granatum TaxID=22663 RepID=A0A2I0IX71_PUNGR|nr:hypothetical protein CRG98_031255 [Punica granatum]
MRLSRVLRSLKIFKPGEGTGDCGPSACTGPRHPMLYLSGACRPPNRYVTARSRDWDEPHLLILPRTRSSDPSDGLKFR